MLQAPHAVRKFGDPVLKFKCVDVTEIDAALHQLISDMMKTMSIANGVGLAANQVGVQKRLFVYDEGRGPNVVINPEIVECKGEFEYEEGCLSVPKMYFSIARPDYVYLKGLDADGNPLEIEANALLGRIFQHEVDHLDGHLLLDRLDDERRKNAIREFNRREMKNF